MERARFSPGRLLAALPALALAGGAACANSSAPCAAPSHGSFGVTLTFQQSLPIALACDGAVDTSVSCASRPHPLSGSALQLTFDGAVATVTPAGQSPWSCQALAPESAPADGPDGSASPATGCYARLSCGPTALGDGGLATVQIELLARSSTDVSVLVHDLGADCCTDEYAGAWQPLE